MNQPLSPMVKAGRLIRLLGWFSLVSSVAIGTAIAIPGLANSDPVPKIAWLAFLGILLLSLLYLIVGAGVKNRKRWAKIAGVIIAVLSLASIPIGTVIGIFVLVYLVKGWNEDTASI